LLSRRTSLVYGNGTTQSYAWSQAGDLTGHTHTLSGTANTWTLGYSKAHQLVSEAASNAAWGHVASVDETTSYGAANTLYQFARISRRAAQARRCFRLNGAGWAVEVDAGGLWFAHRQHLALARERGPGSNTRTQQLRCRARDRSGMTD
jgi:YD repeat-containing protein